MVVTFGKNKLKIVKINPKLAATYIQEMVGYLIFFFLFEVLNIKRNRNNKLTK